MRIRILLLPTFASAIAACAASPAATPLPPPAAASAAPELQQEAWNLLVDFDHPPELPVIVEHERILHLLVGAHRDNPKECAAEGTKVIATLQGGIPGAYTAPGAKETAYLLTTSSCDDPPGADTDKHRLIILAGSKVTAEKELSEHAMVAVRDLDADGDNELVVVSGRKNDPAGSYSARVLDAEGGQISEMFDFGELAWTRCAGGKRVLQTATILYRVKGTSLEYRADKRQKPCP